MRKLLAALSGITLAIASAKAWSGAQKYERLSASVQTTPNRAIADEAVSVIAFDDKQEARAWLAAMSPQLAKRVPKLVAREEFLLTVHYEAKRAGLDPQMVLGLIQVESAFRKYAVSGAGARGYMQVMPLWLKLIGTAEQNLLHLRTDLRYGCVILRHYIDIENGDMFRALERHNGSLGKAEYPNLALSAWRGNWRYAPPTPHAAVVR